MGRTCGEPDEIELAAMGVELNGSGRAPAVKVDHRRHDREVPAREQSGSIFRVGVFRDFAWLTTCTMHPHGACGEPTGIGLTPIGVKLNGPRRVPLEEGGVPRPLEVVEDEQGEVQAALVIVLVPGVVAVADGPAGLAVGRAVVFRDGGAVERVVSAHEKER